MVELTFQVAVGMGDADVEISVSDRDAAMLSRYSEESDCPEDVPELCEVCQRIRKKIVKALMDQVEDYEDIDVEDLDFSFGFPM